MNWVNATEQVTAGFLLLACFIFLAWRRDFRGHEHGERPFRRQSASGFVAWLWQRLWRGLIGRRPLPPIAFFEKSKDNYAAEAEKKKLRKQR